MLIVDIYKNGEIFSLFLGGKKNGGWFIFKGVNGEVHERKIILMVKCNICRAFMTCVNSNLVMPNQLEQFNLECS